MRMRTMSAGLAVATVAAVVLSACGGGGSTSAGDGEGVRQGFTVGLLLPITGAGRFGLSDQPMIVQRIHQECPTCTVEAQGARDDLATQRAQMDTMITRRVDVIILAPVDARALRSSVEQAHRAGIPVVAYDRLAEGPVSGYVTFDGAKVGRLQGEALLTAMGAKAHGGQVVMMNGASTDPNAGWFQRGALSVLKGKVRIGRSYDTVDWQQSNAYDNMTSAIAALGPNHIDGVLAANDNLATGVIFALKAARTSPLPPITGQDADLAGVQRIVAGQQYMTVYKPFRPEAQAAADMAVALGRGQPFGFARSTVDNSTTKHIPAVLLNPVPVTAGNVKDTLVKDGMYTVNQICTPNLRSACAKVGLTG
jgi:D-xylose transport system substrate-binding protein